LVTLETRCERSRDAFAAPPGPLGCPSSDRLVGEILSDELLPEPGHGLKPLQPDRRSLAIFRKSSSQPALMDDWSNYAMGGGGKVLSISLGKKRAGIREGRSLPDNTGKEAIS